MQGGVNDRNTKEGSREGLMIEIPRKGGLLALHVLHSGVVARSSSKQNLLLTSVGDLTQSLTSMKSVEGSCVCRETQEQKM